MLATMNLLGFSDLVDLFRVSRTRVEQLIRDPDFPDTHYVGAKRTRVWEREDVLRWAKDRGREVHAETEETPGPQ